MLNNLVGKTALVTGASRGIGRSIALELAKQGLERIFLVARNRQKLAQVAAEIEVFGVEVVPLAIDLTDSVAVNIAIAQALRNRQIHLLVNCAGVAHQASFLRSPLSLIQEELDLNLMGTYTITRIIARRMAVQREGTIVNVSSLMGKFAAPTMATYSATKFAILGFTQALRNELAPYNIHVTALLPTLTDTDMVRDFQTFRWVVPMTAERVAQALIAGLQKDSPEILVGWQSHAAVWCHRLAPWLMDLVLKIATPQLETSPNPDPKLQEALATSR